VTVIVAIPTDNGVIMAADSRLARRGSLIGSGRKIHRTWVGPENEQYALLAVAGSNSLAELAKHDLYVRTLNKQPTPEDADAWAHGIAVVMARLATDAKPPLLVDGGYVDGEALLAYGAHLWLLCGQGAVRLTEPFAIGSGAPEARGALHVISRFSELKDPVSAAAVAVQAAIALDNMCGGEIQIETTTINAVTSSDGAGDPPTGQN
jgi:ATP-dependent protease HslVU (ClpYQ) peptidase subunit